MRNKSRRRSLTKEQDIRGVRGEVMKDRNDESKPTEELSGEVEREVEEIKKAG